MNQFPEHINFTLQERQHQWTAGEIPVMNAAMTLPVFETEQKSRITGRLNRYYRQCARSFLSYCSHYLYPQALAEFNSALQTGAPFSAAEAKLCCTVTCNQDHILSLYTDCTEHAATRSALTLRRSDTWDLTSGAPVSAQECFPKGTHIRKVCLAAAAEHCAGQAAAGTAVYAKDLRHRLRRHLNLRNFYLSDAGFYFFYQPYAIAPAFEGCPTFFLPFSAKTGPILPANRL